MRNHAHEETVEAVGLWTAARHTGCRACGRLRVTDQDAVCRRCFSEAHFDEFVDSFQEDAA